jgi:hypothetical protein
MRRLTTTLCVILLVLAQARAGDSSPPVQPVTASVQREPINTVVPVYSALITVGPDKFTFFLPENFRMGGDTAQGKLKVTSLEGDTLITLTFVGPAPTDSTELKPDAYREILAQRYPSGKFAPEFSRPVLGRKAVGFDVEWKGAGGMVQTTRTVYVTTVAGVLELSVTSATKKFHDAQQNFNQVLGSLRASVDGKLAVHRLEEKI